jgi:YD repeat-containing protein
MRLWHQRCARSVLVVLLWLTPALAAAQGVSYIYDELGRLIAVSESAGETAVYTYDAVGNVLAIARWSTATVAVIHVTPGAAAVGATVTISGPGSVRRRVSIPCRSTERPPWCRRRHPRRWS